MTASELTRQAVKSAEIYYRFLEENGRGVSETAVRGIRPQSDCFLLILAARLSAGSASDLDSLLFSFRGRRHTSSEIVPLEYGEHTASVLVRPSKSLQQEFAALSPADLTVLFDLKFLVRRVGKRYAEHGSDLALPVRMPAAPPIIFAHGADPSPEQAEAISGALSSPLSYIWGAPGTGKTRVVLSGCVLSLMQADRRVLLLAPTNNALEQMLYGVIPALEAAGFPQTSLLRLGTATREFAKKAPARLRAGGCRQETARPG